MKKFIPMLFILCVLLFSPHELKVFAEDSLEGSYNENVSWKISGTTITVSGNGRMGAVKIQPYIDYNQTIDTLIVEEGVTSIGESAFSGFRSLKHAKLPESLEAIDMNAFAYCYNLYDINIPDNVHYIGNKAFFCAYFLAKIKDEFVILGNGNLYSYSGKKSEISIPCGVKSISDRIFVTNSSIKSVFIPDGVEFIGENAFFDCTNLQYAVVPPSLENIGNMAFGYIFKAGPAVKDDFTLYCYPNTAGEAYAAENGTDFRYMLDIDGNSDITSYDALLMLRNVIGLDKLDGTQLISADADGDGKVTSYDALTVLNYIVGADEE